MEDEREVKRYGVKGCGECCQCASVARFQCCQFPIVGCRARGGGKSAASPRCGALACARASTTVANVELVI